MDESEPRATEAPSLKLIQRTLEELLRQTCKSFGDRAFSSYEVYSELMEAPKKNGRRRHYGYTYSQVKQRMARASYLEKVGMNEKNRSTIYKFKEENT